MQITPAIKLPVATTRRSSGRRVRQTEAEICVQFLDVSQSPLAGLRFHVPLPARVRLNRKQEKKATERYTQKRHAEAIGMEDLVLPTHPGMGPDQS